MHLSTGIYMKMCFLRELQYCEQGGTSGSCFGRMNHLSLTITKNERTT